jgi:hypothetical protein
LGFFGLSPDVEVRVNDPHSPITDFCFVFVSRRVTEPHEYHIGLSAKDPRGVLLFPMAERRVMISKPETINLVYNFRPFTLTGAGTYTLYLLVDDKLDFETSFTIIEAQPGELD